MSGSWQNWSGRLEAQPTQILAPATTAEVGTAVKTAAHAGQRVKVGGSGHSFSEIGVPDGALLRMTELAGLIDIDPASGLVTVEGGMPLHILNPLLAAHGLALENMGDIDRQTITGAISTGTHGTGVRFGGMATQVRALELVLADGSTVQCSARERPDLFSAARVGLGALGVITKVTLQCVPAYALHVIEEARPLDDVLAEIESLVDDNDHFEFFWFPHTKTALTRRCNRLPADTPLRPTSALHERIVDDFLTNTALESLLRVGTRFPRAVPPITRVVTAAISSRDAIDLSHKVFASRRDVRFNEGEYAFAREHVVDTLREIEHWVDSHDEKVAFPLEVRFVASDDIPLAPTSGRTSAYIAFHQYHRMPYQRYFDAMEAVFAAVDGRPHWGKMHSLDAAALRSRYPRFDEFVSLRNELDPTGVFANPYLDRVLGAVS
ncbi:D-arabinono-1,4-lactone oxidase [Antrihabitans sp. YC2-6]|uniref:D-arabinono-1,4-lactone oxidase n=1 Tax=Antrihabitans sp. YC2-6 TaxID=2799498 RepID=UPI0018F43AB8|nr:D-arabinono-1,4-lactone oxidase [Antrihabitans sp. YC2-6]MBJ8344730.1 FAD-binding protein [Antrihabitans sp. YC2-6]